MMKRFIILLVTGVSSLFLGLSLKLLHHQVSYSHCQIAPRSSNLSYDELKEVARAITVKIKTGSTGGSGTLVRREGNIYTVLTTAHTIATAQSYQIETSDGQLYDATVQNDFPIKGEDIALLQFQSSNEYQVAQLGSSQTLRLNRKVVAAGFSADFQGLNLTKGEVALLPDRGLQEGYQIGYTNQIYKGMSGGPLLNFQGELISINGMMAYPLWGNPYIFEDGSRPHPALQQQMREVAWGIPIHRMAQIAPQAIAIDVVSEIDAIAEETTVLITNSQSVGSGVIVAQNDSTYYVLTAEHVIRNQENYHILAPDGQCYSTDLEKARQLEGVDLAILEFTSQTPYHIATLGNYDWRMAAESNYVFVSGWPISSPRTLSETPTRLLTTGRLLSQEPQIQNALQRSNARGAIDALSLTYGYEMVYSNLTAPGMSGGLVLDSQGRAIGIHGRGSGEVVEDEIGEIRPLKLGYGVGIPIQTFLKSAGAVGIDPSWLNVASTPPDRLNPTEVVQIRSSLLRHVQTPGHSPEHSMDHKSTDAIAWFNYGMSLWQLEQYEEALLAFDRAIEQQTTFYQAWYGRGMMLRFQQHYQQALTAFEQAIAESAGTFAPAWRARAEELVWLNQDRDALQSIEQAISLVPTDVTLQEFQGHLLQRLQRYSEAIQVYQDALELLAYYQGDNLLPIADEEGANYKTSSTNQSIVFSLEPDVAWLYENWGDVRGQVTDKLGMISDEDAEAELIMNLSLAYVNRGNVYSQEEKWPEAIADYSQALELEPENPVIYGNRGLARSRFGDRQGAISDLQQAAALFDSQSDITNVQRALEVLKQIDS